MNQQVPPRIGSPAKAGCHGPSAAGRSPHGSARWRFLSVNRLACSRKKIWQRSQSSSRVFTLIELLVVIAIIGILASLLLPSLLLAKHQAQIAVCGSNLKQVAQGYILYSVDYDGYYPTLGLMDAGSGNLSVGRDYAWTFQGNRGKNDYIQLLAEVFGDQIVDNYNPFVCPLAAGPPVYGGLSFPSAWNYNVWPDVSGRGLIRESSSTSADGTNRSRMMMKPGQPFNFLAYGEGRKDCRILASDRIEKAMSTSNGTNHIRPDHPREDGLWGPRENLWYYPGSAFTSVEGGWEVNFVMDDGSVSRHSVGGTLGDWYEGRGYAWTTYIPIELTED